MNMREIYRKIAKEHNVLSADVKREVEFAIQQAWSNPDKTTGNIAMQERVTSNGEVPKVEDVIRFLAEESISRR